VSGIVYIVKTR